jgi:hypothetical protein
MLVLRPHVSKQVAALSQEQWFDLHEQMEHLTRALETPSGAADGARRTIMGENAGKVLGAAIFGAGWVAGEHAKAYQQCARTRLVAVGSRSEASARRCAQYGGAPDAFITTDFDALLRHPDVDVVSITTPPGFHPDLTMRAARAGKHVCIEKAIALEWSDCLAMQRPWPRRASRPSCRSACTGTRRWSTPRPH